MGTAEISRSRGELAVRDLAYIVIALLFFAGCWLFTRLCERI